MRSKWTGLVFGACLGALLATGCAEGREEFIAKARRAARNQNYEEAAKYFNKALDLAPRDYNAMWGIADVHQREGSLAKQAAMLEKILADAQLKKDYAGVVKPALEENYKKQGMVLEGADAVVAEQFYRKAIKINKKSEAHQGLSKLLARKGDRALKKGQFADAAEAFRAAAKLRIARKARAVIKGKAEIAEFMVFKAEFKPKFEKMKQGFIDAKIYDEKEMSFIIEAEAELDKKDRKKPEFEKMAQRAGLYEVTQALLNLTWKIAEQERPEGATVNYSPAVVDIVEQALETRGRKLFYRFKVKVPEDAIFEQASKIQKGEFTSKVDPSAPPSTQAPEGPAPGAPAPTTPAAPAAPAPAAPATPN